MEGNYFADKLAGLAVKERDVTKVESNWSKYGPEYLLIDAKGEIESQPLEKIREAKDEKRLKKVTKKDSQQWREVWQESIDWKRSAYINKNQKYELTRLQIFAEKVRRRAFVDLVTMKQRTDQNNLNSQSYRIRLH